MRCIHTEAVRDLSRQYLEPNIGKDWHSEYTCPSCEHLLLVQMAVLVGHGVILYDTTTHLKSTYTQVHGGIWNHISTEEDLSFFRPAV